MDRNDLISREALKKKLTPIKLYGGVYCKAITEKDIDNAPAVEIPNYGGQVVPDTLQGWRYEDKQITIEGYMQSLKGEK